MVLVKLKSVFKEYQLGQTKVHALNEITLEIEFGEFVSVWGPSGSGKTTLLNLIGIIDEPTCGRVFINGKDISKLSDNEKSEFRNKSIGYIFQNFNLIPVLSALENVMLPLQINGLSHHEAKKKGMMRLDQVGISQFYNHRPDKLSGGQRQKVSIARALVADPSIIMADEPTANLDSESAVNILNLMRNLNTEEGKTFIFSTHDQRLLTKMDRLIRLEDGRIAKEERNSASVD